MQNAVEKAKQLIKDSAAVRFTVLGMVSVLMFGTYWFQDALGPLKGLFESQLGFTSTQFGLLVSSTTWANLALMIIVGGIALDKWGIRKTGVILAIIAMLVPKATIQGAAYFMQTMEREGRAAEAALAAGAWGVAVSGAGPTLVALVRIRGRAGA